MEVEGSECLVRVRKKNLASLLALKFDWLGHFPTLHNICIEFGILCYVSR